MRTKYLIRDLNHLARHLQENGDTIGLYLLGEVEKALDHCAGCDQIYDAATGCSCGLCPSCVDEAEEKED